MIAPATNRLEGDMPELAARVSVMLAGYGHRLDEDP